VIMHRDGSVISVLALDIADGRVQGVRGIVNPEKLRHLGPVVDWPAQANRRA
jgi:RNA polymerase sigma-70 factor, ECF subfamily